MYQYNAEVIRVIDADTVKVRVDLGFHTHRVEHIRVLNYDAPETRLGKNTDQEQKTRGLEAKAYAQAILPVGSTIILTTQYDKTGKYGRFLANISCFHPGSDDRYDYATQMIKKGHVKTPLVIE